MAPRTVSIQGDRGSTPPSKSWGEGHERYFGCNLMHCKVLASSHQHLMAEAPKVRVLAQDGIAGLAFWADYVDLCSAKSRSSDTRSFSLRMTGLTSGTRRRALGKAGEQLCSRGGRVDYLNHVTLNTGPVRRSPRSEVSDEILVELARPVPKFGSLK